MSFSLHGRALRFALWLTSGAVLAASVNFVTANAGFDVLSKGAGALGAANDPRQPAGLGKVE